MTTVARTCIEQDWHEITITATLDAMASACEAEADDVGSCCNSTGGQPKRIEPPGAATPDRLRMLDDTLQSVAGFIPRLGAQHKGNRAVTSDYQKPQGEFTQTRDTSCPKTENLLTSRDTNVPLSKSPNPHILLVGSNAKPAGADVTPVSKCPVNVSPIADFEKIETPQRILDCQTLTPMQLRRKYPKEAVCHRNMLLRSKKRGSPVDPRLHKFSGWLAALVPQPARKATVDRRVNPDPEYAPEKVRWADKWTQNNNKSDTIVLHDPVTGEHFTASRLARKQGISASAIRKRRKRGWSDASIIAGKQLPNRTRSNSHGADKIQVA